MRPFDDDDSEMPRMPSFDEHSLDDQRIEAILAGTAGPEHAALSSFVLDVRGLTAGPVPAPSAALTNLFTHGFSTENGDLSATTASNVTGPAPQAAGLPKWKKKIMDIKTFVAGLSVAGKLVFGAGVAAAATGGAGTVGALPDPLQHQFAETFDAVSPFDIPDPESGAAVPGGEGGAAGAVPYAYEDPTVIEVPAPPTTVPEVVVTEAPAPVPTTQASAPTPTVPAPPVLGFEVPDEPAPEPEPVPEPTTVPPTTTTAAPAPTTPPPAPSGIETLSLTCRQNEGWTGVVCRWNNPSYGGEIEIYLLKTGPDANPSERIWGNNPTSYVDVHADGTNTYTYQIEVRTPDGTVLGRSNTVTVTMVPVDMG